MNKVIKPRSESVNFWTSFIAVIAGILTFNGIQVPVDAPQQIYDAFAEGGTVIAIILALTPSIIVPITKLITKLKVEAFDWGFVKSPNFIVQTISAVILALGLLGVIDNQVAMNIVASIQGINIVQHVGKDDFNIKLMDYLRYGMAGLFLLVAFVGHSQVISKRSMVYEVDTDPDNIPGLDVQSSYFESILAYDKLTSTWYDYNDTRPITDRWQPAFSGGGGGNTSVHTLNADGSLSLNDGNGTVVSFDRSTDNGLDKRTDGTFVLGYEEGQATGTSPLDYNTGLPLNGFDFVIVGVNGETGAVSSFHDNGNVSFGDRLNVTSDNWSGNNIIGMWWDQASGSMYMGNNRTLSNDATWINSLKVGGTTTGRGTTENSIILSGSNNNLRNQGVMENTFFLSTAANSGNSDAAGELFNTIAGGNLDNWGEIANGITWYDRVTVMPGSVIRNSTFSSNQDTLDGNINYVFGFMKDNVYLDTDGSSPRPTYSNIVQSMMAVGNKGTDTLQNISNSIFSGQRIQGDGADGSYVQGNNLDVTGQTDFFLFSGLNTDITTVNSTDPYDYVLPTSQSFTTFFPNGYGLYTATKAAGPTTTGVTLAPGASSWASVSDRRAKECIEDLNGSLDRIMALMPKSYKYKNNQATKLGFIAQEVMQVIPEAVNKPRSSSEYYTLEYDAIIPELVGAIQEQQKTIELLTQRIKDLEKTN